MDPFAHDQPRSALRDVPVERRCAPEVGRVAHHTPRCDSPSRPSVRLAQARADEQPMSLSDALWAMRLEGYEPTRIVGEAYVDQTQASGMTCDACRTEGLRYAALSSHDDRPHRGLAWCPEAITPWRCKGQDEAHREGRDDQPGVGGSMRRPVASDLWGSGGVRSSPTLAFADRVRIRWTGPTGQRSTVCRQRPAPRGQRVGTHG